MKTRTMLILLTLWCIGQSATTLAQMPITGPSQANILKFMSELPPETMKSIQQLGLILQQDMQEGKLTDAQIQEELKSGNLEQKLRELNPEAGPILDDITQTMKHHSDSEDLTQILNGLAGSVQ
jgi:hypothetical protein